MPARIRQAVLAARELEPAIERLQGEFGLGEPYRDPAVAYFGLENAVFAIGDTFLEVVSPVSADASAARLLDRRGGDCGYMVMFQVEDLPSTRGRAREEGVREVFEVTFDDIDEAHLHPTDMGGAIVSVSVPDPPGSWRWGGTDWEQRSTTGAVAGITVAVADPAAVRARWEAVVGEVPAVEFTEDPDEPGIVGIAIERNGERLNVTPG